MVNLNENQQRDLRAFRLLAEERHLLKRVAEEEAEKVKARVFEDWEERMAHAVTNLKSTNVPNRQIGLAWGTKNQADAKRIVERFNVPNTETPTTGDAPTPGGRVVVTGTRAEPLLSVTDYPVHANTHTEEGEPRTLNLTELPLRYRENKGMWASKDTSDGDPLVMTRELFNPASDIQSTIRTQVDSLPEAE